MDKAVATGLGTIGSTRQLQRIEPHPNQVLADDMAVADVAVGTAYCIYRTREGLFFFAAGIDMERTLEKARGTGMCGLLLSCKICSADLNPFTALMIAFCVTVMA